MQRKSFLLAALALATMPTAAHAAGFDVEQATRAWLDTLQGPARAKSDAYFEGGYWLVLWGALVSMIGDALLLRFGLSVRFRNLGERFFKRPAGVTWVAGLCYALAGYLLTLPWSIYTGFLREQQYDLMNQTFGGWFADSLKGLAISLVLFPLLAMAIYAVIRRLPRHWWIAGTGVIAAFFTFGLLIGPVYVAPLFNTYTELPAGPVRERALCQMPCAEQP